MHEFRDRAGGRADRIARVSRPNSKQTQPGLYSGLYSGICKEIRSMHVLVTGAAGFIGSTLALKLLARGDTVTGIDNLNDYYDIGLKQARLVRVKAQPGFAFIEADIADRAT